MSAIQRGIRRFGHTKTFALVMKHVAHRLDNFVSRVTGGKRTLAGTALPTLILVPRGARSGKTYHTPRASIDVGDGFGLVGSNYGQQHHPAWSGNLLANADAEVVVDGQTIPVRARRVSGDEKAALWPRFTAIWPAYDTYVERSGRDLRVFVLEKR